MNCVYGVLFFAVKVENLSNAPAGSFATAVRLEGQLLPGYPKFMAGPFSGSETFFVTALPSKGYHSLWALVDSNFNVMESNEGNNVATRVVFC